MHRIPALAGAEIGPLVKGSLTTTPDGHAVMGEAPEVRDTIDHAGLFTPLSPQALGQNYSLQSRNP